MATLQDDDGYRLWLRYERVSNASRLAEYGAVLQRGLVDLSCPSLDVIRRELSLGVGGLLEQPLEWSALTGDGQVAPGTLVVATRSQLQQHWLFKNEPPLSGLDWGALGDEGYAVFVGAHRGATWLVANTSKGLLYGAFELLRHLQTERPLGSLQITSRPRIAWRMLNHWDNLDRTIERGYAGFSLWDWHLLPDYVDPRYMDYARACASVGINASVLTNVNANARVLTAPYLHKVAALASVFRRYGIRTLLTARFSAPLEIGGLSTADPLDPLVQAFWQQKADEIYALVPDFGGFLVKANSEGQPGPEDYGRSHAQGANLLARVLQPHGGIVIWRAFVYKSDVPDDRAKQAYAEFEGLDGAFGANVVLQVKNGPIDFQPREPFHPLFGAMPKTALAAEFQLTQEYLGCATHLVYLAPLIKETLDADTYCQGPGSTVACVVDGSLHARALSAIAAVSNIGSDRNWCGHPFAQANWYAFGRLAWDPDLTATTIADEWLRCTFSKDEVFVEKVKRMMLASREAAVDYMTPLGLHHIMARDHHWGPGPWVVGGRADWTSTYYHRADAEGLGFDRSPAGSNAVAQYNAPLPEQYGRLDTCPEQLLLWFHHVPWQQRLSSGRTLWEELCLRYQRGVDTVDDMREQWRALHTLVDARRFEHVSRLLAIQAKEARWWRDACVSYFQSLSKLPLPPDLPSPEHPLEYYQSIEHHYVPGI